MCKWRVNWPGTGVDIKDDTYEALLTKGAEDISSGAWAVPRPLIDAMCLSVTRPSVPYELCGGARAWARMKIWYYGSRYCSTRSWKAFLCQPDTVFDR